MKRSRPFPCLLAFVVMPVLIMALIAQQETHQVTVINIEVPVRVFKGETFVGDLALDDFEVFEDGVLQNINAVYLIKKTSIERKEEKKKVIPQVSRSFYLLFEIAEYTPRLEDALSYFFQNVLIPGDQLVVITPLKTYRMKNETFQTVPRENIVQQLKDVLRKDALIANSEYRSLIKDIALMARALSASIGGAGTNRMIDPATGMESFELANTELDELLNRYAILLDKLENLRRVDEQKLLNFAHFLKEKEGQKYVFLFYQREFLPQVEPRILNQYINMHQDRPDIIHNLTYLFDFFKRDLSFNVDRVKQAYADSSISIHFLFFTKPAENISGVRMEEHSEDIFSAFREMALATGGSVQSSANPTYLFQRAADASENYYLIYYTPQDYKVDWKFRKIEVRVKGKNYRITHRAGYFAN